MKIEGTWRWCTGSSRGHRQKFRQGADRQRCEEGLRIRARSHPKCRPGRGTSRGKVVAAATRHYQRRAVAAAAKTCKDVTLVVNNAGINLKTGIIAGRSTDNARAEFNTNFFGHFRREPARFRTDPRGQRRPVRSSTCCPSSAG